MSVTNTVTFTTSRKVAPPPFRTRSMFWKICRVCAAMSSIALSPTHDINTAAITAISDTLHRMNGDAAAKRDRLPVHGFSGTSEEIERQWYEPERSEHLGGGGERHQSSWNPPPGP